MFETLMKSGAFRVDYLEQRILNQPDALALYVRGDLPSTTAYSRRAKRHLLAGLCVICRNFGAENLVAVYIDICDAGDLERPAYMRLKEDLRSGKVRRIFVFQEDDLLSTPDEGRELEQIAIETGAFELIAWDKTTECA